MRLSPRDPYSHFWFSTLAVAHALEGNLETAYGFASRATQMNANYRHAHSTLAAVTALLGTTEEARATAERVLAIDPSYSITRARERTFHPEKFEFMLEGLRRAGLPE